MSRKFSTAVATRPGGTPSQEINSLVGGVSSSAFNPTPEGRMDSASYADPIPCPSFRSWYVSVQFPPLSPLTRPPFAESPFPGSPATRRGPHNSFSPLTHHRPHSSQPTVCVGRSSPSFPINLSVACPNPRPTPWQPLVRSHQPPSRYTSTFRSLQHQSLPPAPPI